jgi:hypothetical protein
MSDNTSTPVQSPPGVDKSKAPDPSNDRKSEGTKEAGKPTVETPAGGQATDQKS